MVFLYPRRRMPETRSLSPPSRSHDPPSEIPLSSSLSHPHPSPNPPPPAPPPHALGPRAPGPPGRGGRGVATSPHPSAFPLDPPPAHPDRARPCRPGEPGGKRGRKESGGGKRGGLNSLTLAVNLLERLKQDATPAAVQFRGALQCQHVAISKRMKKCSCYDNPPFDRPELIHLPHRMQNVDLRTYDKPRWFFLP